MDSELSLLELIRRVNSELGLELPSTLRMPADLDATRVILSRLNEYLFQTHSGIGTAVFNDEEYQYFSEFHKYWEKNHAEILDLKIDPDQVQVAAKCLAQAVSKYGSGLLAVDVNTHGLNKEAIAQIRFLSAIQDFRVPPTEPYQRYLEDPSLFDSAEVASEPERLLKALGTGRLSQSDKRIDFARNSAQFLIERRISAYEIAAHFGNDAVKVRDGLVASTGMGYAQKKANMFVRDMFEMGVWPGLLNFEGIDVASDINTMKVALRTRILKPSIPLLSSFLDIFGYQYSVVDRMSAAAWRAVWEEWRRTDPATAPLSPAQLDFLLYTIGHDYCKDLVAEYRCTKDHHFLHFGGKLRRCPECTKRGMRTDVSAVRTMLPCQVSVDKLPHERGRLLLDSDNLLSRFEGVCIFEGTCAPKRPSFRPFDPPKSISVLGQTSWTNSYADRDLGGGGMMG